MSFQERLALAPMMEITDAAFRALLRILTRKTVLYTEMVVDDTINHSSNLDFFVGKHPDIFPSVIQLGGSNPETLAEAAEKCAQYDPGYAEINLNCGCPSDRVAKRCFGAQLMLKPELVREIVYSMKRRASIPISVKCRLGIAGQRDTYTHLTEFIHAAHSGGCDKFIIHSRDCLLDGLHTPKQNRDIPPLRYDVVHQLCADFPDLKFVLNGGVQTFEQAKRHFGPDGPGGSGSGSGGYVSGSGGYGSGGSSGGGDDGLCLPPVHGVMIGRAVAADPLLFATADSEFFGSPDPCTSRRSLLDSYCDYCDTIQSDSGPRRINDKGKTQKISSSLLIAAMRNCMTGLRNNKRYLRALNDIYVERIHESEWPLVSDIIQQAIKQIADEDLDAPLGLCTYTNSSQQV